METITIIKNEPGKPMVIKITPGPIQPPDITTGVDSYVAMLENIIATAGEKINPMTGLKMVDEAQAKMDNLKANQEIADYITANNL